MVGSRPGAPALAAALAGTLSLSAAAVTAGLASALGVAVGAAAAALVRAAGERAAQRGHAAGLLAGVFSVHLVAGYLANLVLAATFLAAAAMPGRTASIVVGRGAPARGRRARASTVPRARDRRVARSRRARVAGGRPRRGPRHRPVRHRGRPRRGRGGARDDRRVRVRSHAETSRDGYLRRAGLDATLVDAYRERFRLRAARYVQWISVPLAVAGTIGATGFLQRFLISWLAVIAIGIPVGYVTGWLPPDRLVTFGFAVPIAAALGLVWVRRRLGARAWLARAVIVVLAGWMIVGALLAWGRQRPSSRRGKWPAPSGR